MAVSAHFYSNIHEKAEQLDFRSGAILFHGAPIDDRGVTAVALDGAPTHEKILVSYDVENMSIEIGGVSASADFSADLIHSYMDGRQVILEATTLGFAELFCLIRALVKSGVERFSIIYIEPLIYTKPAGTEMFALSELISGYHPIPHAVVDLSSDEVEAGVFFLGYEPERMARALAEYQMIANKSVKIVFGVPAFRAGWELNAIVPHLPILSEQSSFDIAYCSASDPGAAFDNLQQTRKSLSSGAKMFVAPIGTKPCGIATAVFVSLFPDEAGIIFDHPRKKAKRSSGVNVWHNYSIKIDKC